MGSHTFLILIAIILLATKVLGLVSQKVHMPQVIGALLAGLILGPSVLGLISETEFLSNVSTIGVLLLMFLAGLDTDIEDLKQAGSICFAVAALGIFFPIVLGILVHYLFFANAPDYAFIESVFIGVVLTATSVSITVETLRELGRLKGKIGTILLGAAIIDDIVGVLALTIMMSAKDNTISMGEVLLKAVLFFVLLAVLFVIFKHFGKKIDSYDHLRRTAIYGFAFCLALSYFSEVVFGLADITGAYAAGLILCNSGVKHYIAKKITIISYMFFSPLFFANVGITTSLDGFTPTLLLFSVVLFIIALASKILGGYIGAKAFKMTSNEATVIGCGMVARSEVALIMAQKGASVGLISSTLFPPVILIVIATTLITPILLKITTAKLPPVGYMNHH